MLLISPPSAFEALFALSTLSTLFTLFSGCQARVAIRANHGDYSQNSGLVRNITIVTDVTHTHPVDLLLSDQRTQMIVYPSHTWIVFEGTRQDPPMRVELVRTMLNGKVGPPAIAVLVYPLGSSVTDILLQDPLPNSQRTIDRRRDATVRSNSQLFSPRSSAVGLVRPSIIHDVWTRNSLFIDRDQGGINRLVFGTANRFAVALLSEARLSVYLPDSLTAESDRFPIGSRIAAGDAWARWQRATRPGKTLGHNGEYNYENVEHLFYSLAPAPGGPQDRTLERMDVFQVDKSNKRKYAAVRVPDSEWTNSLTKDRPALKLEVPVGTVQMQMSKDAVLTSDIDSVRV